MGHFSNMQAERKRARQWLDDEALSGEMRMFTVGPPPVHDKHRGPMPRPGQWLSMGIEYVRGPDRWLYLRVYGVFDTCEQAEADGRGAPCGPLTAKECRTFRVLPNGKLYDRVRAPDDDHIPSWDDR